MSEYSMLRFECSKRRCLEVSSTRSIRFARLAHMRGAPLELVPRGRWRWWDEERQWIMVRCSWQPTASRSSHNGISFSRNNSLELWERLGNISISPSPYPRRSKSRRMAVVTWRRGISAAKKKWLWMKKDTQKGCGRRLKSNKLQSSWRCGMGIYCNRALAHLQWSARRAVVPWCYGLWYLVAGSQLITTVYW